LITRPKIKNAASRLLACGDLAQPAEVRRPTGSVGKSGRIDELEGFVDHLLVAESTQPSRDKMRMRLPFMELGDKESSARFEHSIHLVNSGLLIISGHVVERERAGDSIERGICERQLLGESDLEVRRHSFLACSGGCPFDHLDAGVNAFNRAARSYSLGEHHREPARSAPYIESSLTGSELQIVSEHGTHPISASAEQARAQIVEPRPMDESVTVVVMNAVGVDHDPCRFGSSALGTF
jgi:hypothetical protein